MLHCVCSSPNTSVSPKASLPFLVLVISHLKDRSHGACVRRSAVASFATQIDKHSLQNGLPLPQRSLFFLHCKTGALDAAIALFARISHAHILVWNAFIQAQLRNGLHHRTLPIFDQMLQEGILPNKVTFTCLLSACSVLQWLLTGRQVHALIQFGKLSSNLIVKTALLDMYGKCGSLEAASETMETLSQRDTVTFNAMLKALLRHRCEDKTTLQCFEQMQQEGVMPNRVTYITVVEACAVHDILAAGEHVCARTLALKEFQTDLPLRNALIHMYGECDHPKKAEEHFVQMPSWDSISWNTLLGVYDDIKKVLVLFNLMQEKGFLADECTYVTLLSSCADHTAIYGGMWTHLCLLHDGLEPSIAISSALLSMYGRCGSVEDAKAMFNQNASKNVVCWNAMVAVYTQHNNNEDAIRLFQQMMRAGMQPDKVIFANVLTACANAALLVEGERLCLLVFKCGLHTDHVIGTSIVNLYGKCGELEEAWTVFLQVCRPTILSWNVMLTMYAYHGESKSIFELFNRMQKEGFIPDGITCLAFLSGCDHLGLVSEGVYFFMSIQDLYGVVPNMAHCVCMIDLLGKAGELEEAAFMMEAMPFLSDEVSSTAFFLAHLHQIHLHFCFYNLHDRVGMEVLHECFLFLGIDHLGAIIFWANLVL